MRRLLASLALLSPLACGGPPPAAAPEEKGPSGPLTLAEILPLEDATVSSFVTRTDAGDEGILILEIFRPRPNLVELQIAGHVQRLLLEGGAVQHATGGVLLSEPLEAGRTFRGSFGEVRIDAVDVEVQVPLGTLKRCVLTTEESQNPPKRAETAFCSGVGLTRMVVEAEGDAAVLRIETELQSHGPRVDLSVDP